MGAGPGPKEDRTFVGKSAEEIRAENARRLAAYQAKTKQNIDVTKLNDPAALTTEIKNRISQVNANLEIAKQRIVELQTYPYPQGGMGDAIMQMKFNDSGGTPPGYWEGVNAQRAAVRQRWLDANKPAIADLEKSITQMNKTRDEFAAQLSSPPKFITKDMRNNILGLNTNYTKTWVYTGVGDEGRRDPANYALLDSSNSTTTYRDEIPILPKNINLMKTVVTAKSAPSNSDDTATEGYILNPDWTNWSADKKGSEPSRWITNVAYAPEGYEVNPAWIEWYKTKGLANGLGEGGVVTAEPPRWGNSSVGGGDDPYGITFIPAPESVVTGITSITNTTPMGWISDADYKVLTDEEKKEINDIGTVAFNELHSKNIIDTSDVEKNKNADRNFLWSKYYQALDSPEAVKVKGKVEDPGERQQDFWDLLGESYYTDKTQYTIPPLLIDETTGVAPVEAPLSKVVVASDQDLLDAKNAENRNILDSWINNADYKDVHRPWILSDKIHSILSGKLTESSDTESPDASLPRPWISPPLKVSPSEEDAVLQTLPSRSWQMNSDNNLKVIASDDPVVASKTTDLSMRPWLKEGSHRRKKIRSSGKLEGKNISC